MNLSRKVTAGPAALPDQARDVWFVMPGRADVTGLVMGGRAGPEGMLLAWTTTRYHGQGSAAQTPADLTALLGCPSIYSSS